MSDIPRARLIIGQQLDEIAHLKRRLDHVEDSLIYALGLMTREPPSRPKAEPDSEPITPELAQDIRRYAQRAGKHETMQAIANKFGVNIGRVSEVIRGER